jgi:ribonuclease HI
MSVIVRFDGASKGNPGVGGSAAVLYKDGEKIDFCYCFHRRATNNVAEYYGLLGGLLLCLERGIEQVHVEGDSKLVIEQVFGTWKCNDKKMIALCAQAKALKRQFKSIYGKWIPREKNSEADHYSNVAVQRRGGYNWGEGWMKEGLNGGVMNGGGVGVSVSSNPTTIGNGVNNGTLKQQTILEAFSKYAGGSGS